MTQLAARLMRKIKNEQHAQNRRNPSYPLAYLHDVSYFSFANRRIHSLIIAGKSGGRLPETILRSTTTS